MRQIAFALFFVFVFLSHKTKPGVSLLLLLLL